MKLKAPIFVAEEILETEDSSEEDNPEKKAQRLRDRLNRINPEDFGKFTL